MNKLRGTRSTGCKGKAGKEGGSKQGQTGTDEKNRLQAYHKGIYTSLAEADTDLALRFIDDHYDLIEEMLEL